MNKLDESSNAIHIGRLFAWKTASSGKHKIVSALKLASLLGAFTAIFNSSVNADVLALPVGLNNVSVHLEVVRTGGDTFVNLTDNTDPAAIAENHTKYPYAGFYWSTVLSSNQKGLQAWGRVERQYAANFGSINGTLTATLQLTDTIVITPSNCDAAYGETNVEFDCIIPNDYSVDVTPNVQVKATLTPEAGSAPSGESGSATASALFEMAYGNKTAAAFWRRCLKAGLEGPVSCGSGSGGDADSFSGFSLEDEDSTPNGIAGKMAGTGDAAQVGISKLNGGSGTLVITMKLTASAFGGGQGGVIANAEVQADKTFTYAKSGPVFNLPEGWTAWSTSGLVQNNLYVAPPVFKDGFESRE